MPFPADFAADAAYSAARAGGQATQRLPRDDAARQEDAAAGGPNVGAGEAWFLALFIVAEDAPFQTNIPRAMRMTAPAPMGQGA